MISSNVRSCSIEHSSDPLHIKCFLFFEGSMFGQPLPNYLLNNLRNLASLPNVDKPFFDRLSADHFCDILEKLLLLPAVDIFWRISDQLFACNRSKRSLLATYRMVISGRPSIRQACAKFQRILLDAPFEAVFGNKFWEALAWQI